MPGNKSFDYVLAYYPPEELEKTPAKRMHSVWSDVKATSASRAISKFWSEIGEEEGWGKKDVVLIGVMPLGLPKREVPEEEDDE